MNHRRIAVWAWALALILLPLSLPTTAFSAPAPPTDVAAGDHPWDGGSKIDVSWTLSEDDRKDADPKMAALAAILDA